jgi:hypothetical protein
MIIVGSCRFAHKGLRVLTGPLRDRCIKPGSKRKGFRQCRLIDRKDLGLFQYADDPAGALALLQSKLQAGPDEASPRFAHSRIRESKDR